MSNLKQTVTEFLNEKQKLAEELMYEGSYSEGWDNWSGKLPFEFKGVDSYGGEGQGTDFWTVIQVRLPGDDSETAFVKLHGWYTSYEGADYNGWQFVKPRQKTITVYD